jgi:hypothetical protein
MNANEEQDTAASAPEAIDELNKNLDESIAELMAQIITAAFENWLSVDELISRAKAAMTGEQRERWGESETEHGTRAFYRDYIWTLDENGWLDAARGVNGKVSRRFGIP